MAWTVLVVERDPELLEIMRDILTEAGFAVVSAEPASLHQMIQDASADILILNAWLSRPDEGWDILADLKADGTTARIPVLLMTTDEYAIAEKADWLRSMNALALAMPFDMDDLVSQVHAALELAPSSDGRTPPCAVCTSRSLYERTDRKPSESTCKRPSR